MSNNPNNDGFNDADLATLFALNNSKPSDELDKLVLGNALLSQHNSLTQQHETFTQKYAPVLGTAAVLMIAIGLTPMTINTPESKPDLALRPTSMPAQVSQPTAADSNQLSTDQHVTVASTDENITHESGIAESDVAKLATIRIEDELAAGETITESETAENKIVNETDFASIKGTMKTELIREPESKSNVASNGSTPSNQVPGENKPAPMNMYPSELTNSNKEDRSLVSTIKSINAVEKQSDVSKLQDNKATQVSGETPSTTLLNTPLADKSESLKQVPEQDAKLRTIQEASQSVQRERVNMKNYRNSALLWVIEIKRLHKEQKTAQAREELTLFRRKFSDNDYERLLPKELLDVEPD